MIIDTYESILLVVTAKEDKEDQLFGKFSKIFYKLSYKAL